MSSDSSVPLQPLVSQFIPLTALAESPTNPRGYFDPKKLEELALNIKQVGILEPLLVRLHPNGDGTTHQIVCGHRRWRAAKLGGLAAVPCIVRSIEDNEVRLVQLAENAAREDLSPIEEADTYAALLSEGLSLGAIAERLGKKRREIAKRLQLAKLPKRVKDALGSGQIQIGHAELLGRIPDTKLQVEALGRLLYDANEDREGKPILAAVPLAVAKRIVEEEYMTALSLAVFDPEASDLSPLGPCSKCPHLALNNPDLFGDVAAKAVCTNPRDFQLKTERHLRNLRDAGYTVLISKGEVKQAFPYGDSDQLGRDFVDLEEICFEDPKRRRYVELLGKSEKLNTVFCLRQGRVRKLHPAKTLRAALVAAGHSFAKEKQRKVTEKPGGPASPNFERIGEEAVSVELAARLRATKLAPSGWIDLLLRIAAASEGFRAESVIRRHAFEGTKEDFANRRESIVLERITSMTDAEKRSFLVDLLAGDWITTADKQQQALYREILAFAGVNRVEIANHAITKAKRETEAKTATKPALAAKRFRDVPGRVTSKPVPEERAV